VSRAPGPVKAPMTGRPRVARPRVPETATVVAFLRSRDRRFHACMFTLLLLGLPLCLIGPLLITGIAWALTARRGNFIDFWHTFWIVTAVGVPLLLLLAAALKGSVLDQAAEEGTFDASSVAGFYAARRAAGPLVVIEIANAGPRMVLHSVRRLLARRRAGSPDFARVARAVVTLFAADGGIPPAQLVESGERAEVLEKLLPFLMFHDLADVSKNGDRV
jgi:hypothetical protein